MYFAFQQLRALQLRYDKNQLAFTESESFDPITFSNIELGEGVVKFNVIPKEGLFYKVLSRECGYEIADDYEP